MNNSLEFIKQHVTEWPSDAEHVMLCTNGKLMVTNSKSPTPTYRADLSEHFAPSYYDGKVWTREEFEACGVAEYRYNIECVNSLLKRDCDKYFYNVDGEWCEYQQMIKSHWEHAVKISDDMAKNYLKLGGDEASTGIDVTVEEFEAPVSNNKYERELTDRQGNSATIDVYDVLQAFNVTCPATQHAVKKLLCTGVRGHKDGDTDLLEAREAITRAIELRG